MDNSLPILAQEMREYEKIYDMRVVSDKWIILRLDGRGFSGLTAKNFQKPFDFRFHEFMLQTSLDLFKNLQGTYLYTGSDEISIVLHPDWNMFDRRVEKILSLSASMVGVSFALASQLAVSFDSRLIVLSTLPEVIEYFLWRRADVQRCAIQTAIYWALVKNGFSQKQATSHLKKVSQIQKEQMLADFGIVFNTLPHWQQQGVGIVWETYKKDGFDPIQKINVLTERRRMRIEETLPFGKDYIDWIKEHVY